MRRLIACLGLLTVVAVVACNPARTAPGTSRATGVAARGDDPGLACPFDPRGADAPPPPPEDEPVAAPRKRAWEQARGGREAARPHVRARLRGWPARVLADRTALPAADRAFLERLAHDTWRGLDAFVDRAHGLPVDHVRLGTGPTGANDADVGDYTNVTGIGLYLADVVAAHALGFVTAPAARARIARTLATVEGLETHRGLLFNYYDTTSLERTSTFLSFLDSAWLTAGLMVVRATFPELADRCTRLIGRTDFGFFYDPTTERVWHGYNVRRRRYSRYHYGVLYTEARLAMLIAIGKGDVPERSWFGMVRTYPPECRGQSSPPHGSRRKTVRGHPVAGGWYEWQGVPFVPSWGGSMFEALMPTLMLDEARWAPRSLGANARAHVRVQRLYAADPLGYPVWGMSPSTRPTGSGYGEYGVPVLGARGYPPAAVTPHAAALALAVAPDAALANLRRLAARYDVYGDFGLYDALEPRSGAVARTYLTLDQSMILLAAANHLTGGAIQRRFEADPIAARVLPLLGDEDFFD